MAWPCAQPAQSGRLPTHQADSRKLRAERPHLWQPAGVARPACTGRGVRPEPCQPLDAVGQAAGQTQAPQATWRHCQPTGEPHRAEPPAAGLPGRRTEPEVGGRLHLHLDGRGLALCSSGDGSVLAAHRGLVHERDDAGQDGQRCIADGAVATRQTELTDTSLRPGQPRRIQPVVATPLSRRCLWDDPRGGCRS